MVFWTWNTKNASEKNNGQDSNWILDILNIDKQKQSNSNETPTSEKRNTTQQKKHRANTNTRKKWNWNILREF